MKIISLTNMLRTTFAILCLLSGCQHTELSIPLHLADKISSDRAKAYVVWVEGSASSYCPWELRLIGNVPDKALDTRVVIYSSVSNGLSVRFRNYRDNSHKSQMSQQPVDIIITNSIQVIYDGKISRLKSAMFFELDGKDYAKLHLMVKVDTGDNNISVLKGLELYGYHERPSL